MAYIREDACIGCSKCVQACPVDAILGAAIGFLMSAYSDRIPSMMFWTSGSFNGRSWRHFDLLWPYSLIGVIGAALLIPKLKILEMGEDTATSLGVDVGKVRLLTFVFAALLAAEHGSVLAVRVARSAR